MKQWGMECMEYFLEIIESVAVPMYVSNCMQFFKKIVHERESCVSMDGNDAI